MCTRVGKGRIGVYVKAFFYVFYTDEDLSNNRKAAHRASPAGGWSYDSQGLYFTQHCSLSRFLTCFLSAFLSASISERFLALEVSFACAYVYLFN
jgi:hypothetical protein